MRARSLWLASLDEQAQLHLDRALADLRAARAADPSFLPAHFEYIRLLREQDALEELRRDYPATTTDDPLHACLAVAANAPYSTPHFAVPALEKLETRAPSDCTAIFLATSAFGLPLDRRLATRALEYARRGLHVAPGIPELWMACANALRLLGDTAAADAAYREGIARVPAGVPRLRLELDRVIWVRARGDGRGAASLLQAAAREASRDGRPGVRVHYLVFGPGYGGYDEALRLLRAAGAWPLELRAVATRARGELDGGELARSLRFAQRAVALADRYRRPALQLEAHTLRGRVYAKMGRLEDAERDLLRAVQVGESIRDPYLLGEAYHNLAHVYESRRDWERAVRAVDRFAEIYDPLVEYHARVVSLYDAATIRWKAGWHAAAARSFEAMVRAVERQRTEYAYAGEYFERAGDLRRALDYYRRGISEEPALTRAGMVRVYDALGLPDSAEAAARAHDAAPGMWREGPLLPRVLARHGHTDAALSILDRWIAAQQATRNVQSAAAGLLEQADILLAARRPGPAAADAAHAERLAGSLQLTRERIRALRLQGSAELALGRHGAGVRLLERAARSAERHPEADERLETNVALADALAHDGHLDAALVAYDRAARSVERVMRLLDADLDRARYRKVHLAPFDGAARALLRAPAGARRLDQLLRWSERRKAAALALATGLSPRDLAATPRALGLGDLRARLDSQEALLDFLVIDGGTAVVVLRRDRARLVRLGAASDSVRRWSDLLQRGFRAAYAGRVDLARAPYDLALAARLYQALIAPLEPELAGISRLLISPDGPVHSVPFEALALPATPPARGGRPTAGTYLIDRYETAYLPSARFLEAQRSVGFSRGPLLLVAYAAPGGDREAAAVRAPWRGGVRVLAGAAATESAVRRTAGRFSVLHFATHAIADDRDPLASHLGLAADDANDGLFHVPEILDLRLSARLVVLSGCETLGERIAEGEGFLGLARAFLAAGAGSVVATRWPVGDASGRLMGTFYRNLAAGHSTSSALREAKLALRADPATAHPFFWAGFVLVRGR